MKPYYDEAGITIYHGDCREIVSSLAADALITDPPYGVNLGTSDSRGDGHGLAKCGYLNFSDSFDEWLELVPPVLKMSLAIVKRGAVFAGKHLTYQPQPDALGGIYCSSGSGRNKWGFTNFMPIFFYGNSPTIHLGASHTVKVSNEISEVNGHPCPKPIGWMKWLLGLAVASNETVLDPFMGSGTTLRAAKDLGLKAIGIEIEERYCEIAANRLRQGVLFPAEVPA